jgi:hypothetical protein
MMPRFSFRPFLPLLVFLPATLFGLTGDYLTTMTANKWIAFPTTQMSRVTPDPAAYPGIQGATGIYAIMDAWGGGAFDTRRSRLLIWGGGHNDYWGNELYAFDVDSLKWLRLTDPCPNPNLCGQVNPDGSPNTRHTYSGLAYISHADRFFACGGAPACPGGGCGINNTWTFDLSTNKWKNMNPSGDIPRTNCEDNCAYDSVTKKVYYFDGSGGLYAYDYDVNSWTKLTDDGRYNYNCVVDPKRRLLLSIGHGNVFAYSLAGGSLVSQAWTTTGGTDFIAKGAMGLAYDSKTDQIVGWHGGAVYALNPDTKVWTAYTAANAPVPNSNGTFGRWRYIPKYNAFIIPCRVADNTYFYKLSAGGGNAVEKRDLAARSPTLKASPNPFNAFTEISLAGIPLSEKSSLILTDIRGKVLERLATASMIRGADGQSVYRLDGSKLRNGVYFVRLSGQGKSWSVRLLRTR